jgi:hypothetical protein
MGIIFEVLWVLNWKLDDFSQYSSTTDDNIHMAAHDFLLATYGI